MNLPDDACHGPDFFSLCWNGEKLAFTPTQAAIVAVLWKAAECGTPEVHASTLLEAAESELQECRLAPLFYRNPAWKSLIVPGKHRGTYRLNPEAYKKKNR